MIDRLFIQNCGPGAWRWRRYVDGYLAKESDRTFRTRRDALDHGRKANPDCMMLALEED